MLSSGRQAAPSTSQIAQIDKLLLCCETGRFLVAVAVGPAFVKCASRLYFPTSSRSTEIVHPEESLCLDGHIGSTDARANRSSSFLALWLKP